LTSVEPRSTELSAAFAHYFGMSLPHLLAMLL
jgi:hypothetical protein